MSESFKTSILERLERLEAQYQPIKLVVGGKERNLTPKDMGVLLGASHLLNDAMPEEMVRLQLSYGEETLGAADMRQIAKTLTGHDA